MSEPHVLAYPDPPLGDALARLRPWRESDAGCVEEARADPAMWETTTLPPPGAPGTGAGWIRAQWERQADGAGLSLAIGLPADGRAVGAVVLLHRPEAGAASIGCWLLEAERGRGLATSAVRLLARWGLGAGGFARIEALVDPANERSVGMVERAGFLREGHLRSALDLGSRRADALVFSLVPGDP